MTSKWFECLSYPSDYHFSHYYKRTANSKPGYPDFTSLCGTANDKGSPTHQGWNRDQGNNGRDQCVRCKRILAGQ